MRKVIFENDNYYHVYNRGVDKRDVFLDDYDYVRFLTCMREFNSIRQIESLFKLKRTAPKALPQSALGASSDERLIDFVAYSLLSNHYHFLLRQKKEDGISKFMQKVGAGYTSYFNSKYERSGSLFQGTFKAVELKSSDKIIQLSAYVNGNSEIHGYSKAENYRWSSYQDYLLKRSGIMCDKEVVMQNFSNKEEYRKFCDLVINETKEERTELADYLLEN